jgi:N6-adenosine-specific RNA methylase IME4
LTLPVVYEEARQKLAECLRIDEVKELRDQAVAMEVYARQANDGRLIADATAIRKRAERRLGELMEEARRAGKLAKGTQGQLVGRGIIIGGSAGDPPISLPSQGIDKHLADRARKAAAMPEPQFNRQVDRAVKIAVAATENDAAVVREARREQQALKKQRRDERERTLTAKILALPTQQCGVLVEDFEWDSETWSDAGKDRHASNHYLTSSDAHTAEEIVARTTERFLCAADDCVLFMWTTQVHLRIAILVMMLRGFQYKSTTIWDKDKTGTGHWFINKHEQLLVGVRGKVPCPAPGTQWPSVIKAPRGRHSEKPELFLEMIEQYFPNLPKIELNRRGPPRPGWDAWGNEVAEVAEPEKRSAVRGGQRRHTRLVS